MVSLHASGKQANEIIREYELTASTFHKWAKQFNKTGSFKEADNINAVLTQCLRELGRRKFGAVVGTNDSGLAVYLKLE